MSDRFTNMLFMGLVSISFSVTPVTTVSIGYVRDTKTRTFDFPIVRIREARVSLVCLDLRVPHGDVLRRQLAAELGKHSLLLLATDYCLLVHAL